MIITGELVVIIGNKDKVVYSRFVSYYWIEPGSKIFRLFAISYGQLKL